MNVSSYQSYQCGIETLNLDHYQSNFHPISRTNVELKLT